MINLGLISSRFFSISLLLLLHPTFFVCNCPLISPHETEISFSLANFIELFNLLKFSSFACIICPLWDEMSVRNDFDVEALAQLKRCFVSYSKFYCICHRHFSIMGDFGAGVWIWFSSLIGFFCYYHLIKVAFHSQSFIQSVTHSLNSPWSQLKPTRFSQIAEKVFCSASGFSSCDFWRKII